MLWVGGVIGVLILLYVAYMTVRTIVAGRGGRSPEGLSAAAELPRRARVGEQVSLVVRITNSLDRPRTLTSTDLDEALVKGLEVVSVEPVPIEKSDAAVLGTWVFSHQRPIGPGETVTVTFALRAAMAGTFSGNVTVYVDGDHFHWLVCGVLVEVGE